MEPGYLVRAGRAHGIRRQLREVCVQVCTCGKNATGVLWVLDTHGGSTDALGIMGVNWERE